MRHRGDGAGGGAGLDGLSGIDPEWLSAAIGAIYDCVLEPSGWRAAIGTVLDRFSFHSGALAVIGFRRNSHEFKVHYRMDDEWIARQNDYIEEGIAIWGGLARIQSFPLDEPIVASDIRHPDEWREFRYFKEIIGPRGMIDAVVVALAKQPELRGYFAINRHASDGPIRPGDIEGLRLIAPHLRRAVTIANLFDLKSVETSTFRSVLDGMACAVVLVDDDLGIVYANPGAQSWLAAGSLMQSVHGRLSVRGQIASDALRAAVRIAAEDEARLSQRGIGIPVTAVDGSPSVLHVMPLARRELRPGLAQRAVAAVFVMPAGGAHTAFDAIAALYDFTPAEAQIFASLARGTSLDKTAEALGIARSTARTHLLRVFAKTGVGRQAELVALAAKLSLNL